MNIDILKEMIESKKDIFIDVNDKIWDYAEMRYKEFKSSELQCSVLEKQGFQVTKNLGNIETAFMGSYGSGKPVIGILGEFDALSALSQKADAREKTPIVQGGSGHGCGHNTLGSASLEAAVAVKDYMEKNNLKGTIRYYGCPAEESGAGKAFMVREGCFDDVDICLTWHPSYLNTLFGKDSLANVRVYFTFKGKSSHAAATPHLGRSALDGVELMDVGVNYLREHIIPEARVHYAITNSGGDAANVVQAEAQVFYSIRAPKMSQVREIYERVKNVAEGAALMTGTKVEPKVVGAYANCIGNKTLNGILTKNLKAILPIDYSKEDLEYADSFKKTIPESDLKALEYMAEGFLGDSDKAKYLMKKPIVDFLCPPIKMPGSTDVGDVSWVVPTGQISVACYAMGTPNHSWQMTSQGKSSLAHKGMIATSKVLAMSAIEILEDDSIIERAKEDLKKELRGEEYISMIPKDVHPRNI